MNKYTNLSKLKTFFLILSYSGGFYGFHFLVLILHIFALGDMSRIFTVPYRALFLLASLLIVSYGLATKSFSKLGKLWIPLLLFWIFYFIRIIMDGYLFPVHLYTNATEYIQKSLGVAFIPMFIFLLKNDKKNIQISFKSFFVFNIACVFFIVLFYREILFESYRSIQYKGFSTELIIDPISLSYFGVVMFVVSFFLFAKKITIQKKSLAGIFLLGMLMLLGAVVILVGESRSAPLCALILCIIISFPDKMEYKKIRYLFILVGIIILISSLIVGIFKSTENSMIKRYSRMIILLQDKSLSAGSSRIEIYSNTIQEYLENPFLGSGLEIKKTGYYPHNHILEAFMATGLIGGTCFIILCWVAIKKSFQIIRKKNDYGWIACVFLIYFIRGLFSGPIIESSLWYSMIAVFSIPNQIHQPQGHFTF